MNQHRKRRSEIIRDQLDELLIQQHVVRRFRLNHAEAFNTLALLRKELEDCLLKISRDLPDTQQLSRQIRTIQLAQCINHFDVKVNLRLVATGARDAAYENFVDDLYGGGNSFELSPLFSRVLAEDNDACAALFEILLRYAGQVLEIRERLNFLDYYSPFAMTSFVAGKNMYLSYLRAKAGIDELRRGVDDETAAILDARWLFTTATATNNELSSLVHTYCYRSNKPSRNIKIIGGKQHAVTIDGQNVDNCLFLCVPINDIPDRIDESLRYFRDALYAELNGYFWEAQKEMQRFECSRFMTQFSRRPLLVTSWDQVQKNIVGLWVWDEINLEVANINRKPKVIDMYEPVREEMLSLKDSLGHDIKVYAERSIKGCGEMSSSLIGSINSQNRSSLRALDTFVTGENIRLGRRDDDAPV